ncbi:MAG: methyltransferase domain-containing protein [Lachnospiraceae bacterium]|nr:methyltransferase domain-containing protein [Lachnospiraceae bacterium]
MRLYDINRELKDGKNYIYGDGLHALVIGGYYEDMKIPFDGFVAEQGGGEILGRPILSLEQLQEIQDANVLITETEWQAIYDKVYEYIMPEHIFMNTTWLPRKSPCIACNNMLTFSSNALFVPFLVERMFLGKEKPTLMMHCPKCGMYYSYYRPSDEEMGRLYSGYRDEIYQQQREKYESAYTKEFNESLFEPQDGGKSRMDGMIRFMKEFVDFEANSFILDFGGDKGQFIPPEFKNSEKFVYEISGSYVLDGIHLITDCNELLRYNWDVIFCNMVMEHLSDIQEYFSQLVSYMTENTILYIEVPIERYMENAEVAYIHEHINFFREKTFYELAKQNNVQVIKSETTDVIRCLIRKE